MQNCAALTDCIRKINNTQVDNTNDNDAIMSMHNLNEYGDSYSKKCYRD